MHEPDQSGGSGSAGARRTASILIRTKNEAASIGATLDALRSQTVRPHEVFVIDSGSRDRTVSIACDRGARILTISPREWSYPRALNVGAREASGEILVCLSAHCRPTTDRWLAALVRHFDDPQVAAVWGPDLLPGRTLPVRRERARQEPGSYNVQNRAWGMTNSNSALRRSLWLQFPFDESLPATEDKAWGREAMERGYTLVWEPEAAVWHGRDTLLNAYRRNRAVQQGFHLMFPELDPPAPLYEVLMASARQKLTTRWRDRDLHKLYGDLRNVPTKLAGELGRRRGSRSAR